MSKRARRAAADRLELALFGPGGATLDKLKGEVPQPSERQKLLAHAAQLRELAARGMSVRKYTRAAEEAEAKAALLP